MKAFFITGSIIFTVIILILAFENMVVSCNGYNFILFPMANPFFIVASTAGMGMFAGIFYTGLVMTLLNKNEDEEEGGLENF